MSKTAEKRVEELLDETYVKGFPKRAVAMLMREHVESRLSELKERVEGLRSFGKLESMNDIAVSKKQILNLIEQMQE